MGEKFPSTSTEELTDQLSQAVARSYTSALGFLLHDLVEECEEALSTLPVDTEAATAVAYYKVHKILSMPMKKRLCYYYANNKYKEYCN